MQVRDVVYGSPFIDIWTGGTVPPPFTVIVLGIHGLAPLLVKFAKTTLLTETVTGYWFDTKRLLHLVVEVVDMKDIEDVVDVEALVEAGIGFTVTTAKLAITAATMIDASTISILTIRPSFAGGGQRVIVLLSRTDWKSTLEDYTTRIGHSPSPNCQRRWPND